MRQIDLDDIGILLLPVENNLLSIQRNVETLYQSAWFEVRKLGDQVIPVPVLALVSENAVKKLQQR